MNSTIKEYYQEKVDLVNNPESYEKTVLFGKEMLSIARAIKFVFESLKEEEITPEDIKAYEWALNEIDFRGEDSFI